MGIIIFVAALWLPIMQMTLHFLPEMKLTENRFLADRPDIHKFSLRKPIFQKEFEKYFSDHFGFRGVLIYLNNYLMVKHFNASPNPNIAIGKQGWLYFDDTRNNDRPFRDYMGLAWYKDIQLTKIISNLNSVRNELNKRGITFLVVIAPNKQTIYPEYLPDSIKQYQPRTKAAQLMEHLRHSMPELQIIDLRPILFKAKVASDYPLYSKTDSHWNALGGYIASAEIVRALMRSHAEIQPLVIHNLIVKEFNSRGGDIAGMLSMSQAMEDTEVRLSGDNIPSPIHFTPPYASEKGDEPVGFTMNNSRLPRLLMLRDSFGSALIPYLSGCFSRSVFLSTHSIDPAIITHEKPNIVILEIVERNLDRLLGEDLYLNKSEI